MNKQNYILGGGIAGLIWAYYNPDFTIITETVGGQFNNYFPMGPRFLEDNEFSRKFLTDLKIPIIPQTIKIGYKYGNKIIDTYDTTFLQKYYSKSRGAKTIADSTVMNQQKKEMDILKVDFLKLISLLVEKIGDKRIIYSKIYKIDIHKKEISIKNNKIDVNYNKIVSTIPLPAFYRIIGKRNICHSRDMTYVLLEADFIDMKDFNFIYCCGNEPYHRLTKCKDGIIADVLGWKSEGSIKSIFPEYIGFKCAPNIQIVSGPSKEKFNEDIQFIGRYGRWNRNWKTEKVIEEAIKNGQ